MRPTVGALLKFPPEGSGVHVSVFILNTFCNFFGRKMKNANPFGNFLPFLFNKKTIVALQPEAFSRNNRLITLRLVSVPLNAIINLFTVLQPAEVLLTAL